MSVLQSFMITEEQSDAVDEMMEKTGLQKSQLYRRALALLAAELDVEWPDDPKPGRPWHKEAESDDEK
jgi:hypothetical protein